MTERALKVCAGIAWFAYSALLGALYLQTPPSPDLQIFDYAGWIASQGGRLYVDVVEQNWPGAMWLHTLAVQLFGTHLWTFRAFDFLLVCAAALTLGAFLSRVGNRWAAFVIVPLYQAMYVTTDVWGTGQRDVIVAEILMGVALMLAIRQHGGRRLWLVGVGVGIFLAVMVRPTYLIAAPLFILADALSIREGRRTGREVTMDALLGALAFLVCVGALLAYGKFTGGLTGFKEAALDFNTQAYTPKHASSIWRFHLLSTLRGWYAYILFAIAGALVWFRQGDRSGLRLVLALMMSVVVSLFVAHSGFGYHYGAFLPGLAVLFAYLIGYTLQRAARERTRLRVGLAALVMLGGNAVVVRKLTITFPYQFAYLTGRVPYRSMLQDGKPLADGITYWDALMCANFVKQHSTERDSVLVWDRAVFINTLAHRKSPTPFITSGMLRLADPPFAHSDKWNGLFREALEGPHPPVFIVIPGPGNSDYDDTILNSPGRAVVTLKRALATRYQLAKEFGTLDVYALRN